MSKKETIELTLTLTLEKEGEDLTLKAVSVDGADIPIEFEEADHYEEADYIEEEETILGVDKTTALAVGMGLLGVGQDK
jgi:hypothetical protein